MKNDQKMLDFMMFVSYEAEDYDDKDAPKHLRIGCLLNHIAETVAELSVGEKTEEIVEVLKTFDAKLNEMMKEDQKEAKDE